MRDSRPHLQHSTLFVVALAGLGSILAACGEDPPDETEDDTTACCLGPTTCEMTTPEDCRNRAGEVLEDQTCRVGLCRRVFPDTSDGMDDATDGTSDTADTSAPDDTSGDVTDSTGDGYDTA